MQRKFAVKSEIKMKRKEGEKFSRTMRKKGSAGKLVAEK